MTEYDVGRGNRVCKAQEVGIWRKLPLWFVTEVLSSKAKCQGLQRPSRAKEAGSSELC